MKKFTQIWLVALVVKTIFAIWLPLSNDEAYYWVWGHHPQLSYFDHPPFVGWLFYLGTFIENFGNAARLPGVWLGHLTLLIWREILKPYMDEKRLSFWLVFILLSPFFGVGSIIITPDVPLVFFWSLSLLLFIRLLQEHRAWQYAAFGAALGLGFCAKYMIVLFVPAALAWIAWSGEWRRVRWALVPVTVFVGLAFCFPVLYWNYRHEWASFVFQLNHGLSEHKKNPLWPLEYIGGQIGLLFPITVYFAARRRELKGAAILHFFGWIPLAFFFYTSFKAHVEANWPTMAHPAILSLAVINADNLKWLKVTVGIWATALLIVVSQVIYPWMPIDAKKLKTSEFSRFDFVLPVIEAADAPIYLASYQMAGAASYKLRRQVYKLPGLNRRDFYDFTPLSQPSDDKFYVVAEPDHSLPEWLVSGGAYQISRLRTVENLYSLYEVTRSAKDTRQ